MGKLSPPQGAEGPTLDVQVLEGLESYIATTQFLHTLEQASAEWIDLSEHQHPTKNLQHGSVELMQVNTDMPPAALPAVVRQDPVHLIKVPQQGMATGADAETRNNKAFTCFLSRFSFSNKSSSSSSRSSTSHSTANGRIDRDCCASSSGNLGITADTCPPCGTAFELVEQSPPGHSGLQEPFVLVSADDAIEGMAYYIAMYLSRAPEARHMEPKQLQAALKQTFTAIRRRRYRVIWDWGRWLYRATTVSYGALQLYEHPWVVRAVVAAVWTSSKMALGFLW